MKIHPACCVWAVATLGLLIIGGCRTDSNGDSDGDNAALIDFEIVKPPSFTGEFNPDNLEVAVKEGALAPEIEGEDLDGVPFKLSDYRGKVVMLDFWGDW